MKQKRISLLVLAGMLLCSACRLFPAEEEFPDAPMVYEGEEMQYNFVEVKRGDLIEEKRVTAIYTAEEEQDVVFLTEGQVTLYVARNEKVKKGQLLAERDADMLHLEIDSQKEILEDLQIQIEDAKWRATWLQDRKKILTEAAAADPEAYSLQLQSNQQEIEGNEEELKLLEENYSFEKKVLSQKQADLAERQIYAVFDGIVTYTRTKFEEGGVEYVDEGRVVATIANYEEAAYYGELDEAWVEEGQSVLMTIDNVEYDAYVETLTQNERGKWDLRLQFRYAGMEPEVGGNGIFNIVINSIEDVLYLPSIVVHEGDGLNYVYCLNEDGIKSIKEVEIGQKINNLTEIVSGLEEGEMVIR